MKRMTLMAAAIAVMALISGSAFSQMWDGPMRDGPGRDGWNRGHDGFHHRGMMDGSMGIVIMELHLESTLETFHVSVEKVRLDAAEKKIALNEKKRNAVENLKSLFKKYQSDKTVSKDIVQTLKDLNSVRLDIRKINEDAMAKIKALKAGLDIDIDKAVDAYLQKLPDNTAELDKISKFFDRGQMRWGMERD